ncbi:MAG: transglutaminase-like domain-containing protein [Pseudomonadales bacterium]
MELLLLAAPMAVLLEARYFINRRWALDKKDFYRLADLTSIGLFGLVVYLALNATKFHFITTLFQLLPFVFFPLVVVLAYSTSDRMTLDVLFYSLRRQKEPVTQSWDMDYFLVGVCLLAIATDTSLNIYYLPIAGLLICWALFPLRSPRYQTTTWILAASLIFLTAHITQLGIKEGQEALKKQSARWLANFIMNRTDPMKTTTALGNVGRMKLSDTILFRVKGIDSTTVPALMQEASYDLPSGTNWMVLDPSFRTQPHVDNFLWHLATPQPSDHAANIFLEFTRDHAIVPVPDGVTAINDLPARDIKVSQYGSVQGIDLVRSPGYQIQFNESASLNSEPQTSDRYIPAEYIGLLQQVAGDKKFDHDENALAYVRRFFGEFRYSLYQPGQPGQTDPLEHFLLHRKKGHCEYFASATTLLLRHFGIPARYVVGYAVQEYDPTLEMFVVRKRHAHTWSIAFIDGQWKTVDTTPSVWAEEEAANAGILQPVYDFIVNRTFQFQLWWNAQKLEDYEIELIVIGMVLALVLIWRITTSEQVILKKDSDESSEPASLDQGADSSFFRIEQFLEESGFNRGKGEVVSRWLQRIGHSELLPLLQIHNKWRFDPAGIDQNDKALLIKQVDNWLSSQTSSTSTSSQEGPPS